VGDGAFGDGVVELLAKEDEGFSGFGCGTEEIGDDGIHNDVELDDGEAYEHGTHEAHDFFQGVVFEVKSGTDTYAGTAQGRQEQQDLEDAGGEDGESDDINLFPEIVGKRSAQETYRDNN